MHRVSPTAWTAHVAPMTLSLVAALTSAAICAAETPSALSTRSATTPVRFLSATVAKVVIPPRPGRRDVLYDLEKRFEVEQQIISAPTDTESSKSRADNDLAAALQLTTSEELLIGDLLKERRYVEVVDRARALRVRVLRFADDEQMRRRLVVIDGFATQAQDAIIRKEALEQFAKLNVRVEGIFWSDKGTRLAMIAGEPQALSINKVVKNLATILTIDQDRVDFRFKHAGSGRSFEFPVFIGEDFKDTSAAAVSAHPR